MKMLEQTKESKDIFVNAMKFSFDSHKSSACSIIMRLLSAETRTNTSVKHLKTLYIIGFYVWIIFSKIFASFFS